MQLSNKLTLPAWVAYTHRRRKGLLVGGAPGTMASAECEPITGVWGWSAQPGLEAEPLVRGITPPEAESFKVFVRS